MHLSRSHHGLACLFPVRPRHTHRTFGDRIHRTTENARAAGRARVQVDHCAVVRLLRRFGRAGKPLTVEYPAAARAAVARAHELRRVRAHREAVEREVHVPHLLEPAEQLRRLLPIEHGFAERRLRREADEAAPLHRFSATVAVQQFHLPLAHAWNDEEALVALEVGVDIEVWLPLDVLRLQRAPHRDDAQHAWPRRENPLAAPLDHELLEQPGELLVLSRIIASYQPTRNGPSRYFFSPTAVGARPGADMPGESRRTSRRGMRLSSVVVTSPTSRRTRAAISAAVRGGE